MLIISAKLYQAMADHALREHPIEACGIIAGPRVKDFPERFCPMKNQANSTEFFQLDSQEQLQVWREMDRRDEHPWVIYHSHTASRAYPSGTDKLLAMEPLSHYVILSTDKRFNREIRSFRIIDNKVTEETIQVIDQY